MSLPTSETDFTAEDVATKFSSEIKGKNVIITGGSPGGIGAEAARVIAKYANLVVITGRTQSKLDAAVEAIKKETPSANLRTLIMDQDSLASVRKAAAEVNAYSELIHARTITLLELHIAMLIYVTLCRFSSTALGSWRSKTTLSALMASSQLATNHLSHFLFTLLIFPRIVASTSPSSKARIVNISSLGHNISDFRFDDYNFSDGKTYGQFEAYGQSKTANILFTNEIARRAKATGLNVLSFSVHPGVIASNLANHLFEDKPTLIAQGWMNEAGEFLAPILTLGQGAAGYLVAAFDPSIAPDSGAYLADAKVTTEDRATYTFSEENGIRLWELSEKLVGQKFDF